jgi:hypothetical protein
LDANQTKILGDTSEMTPEQRKTIAKKLGVSADDLDQYSGQVVPINAKNYADFKKQYNKLWHYEGSDLQKKAEARIAGYEKAKSNKKMANQVKENDWSNTTARTISSEEKRQVIQYANNKGVTVVDIDAFDGDTELLKVEIDTISEVCKEFGIKSSIKVSSKVLDDDSDFAITNGLTITFNSKALRDRTITERNIAIGKQFASVTLEDIALHEAGHIIAKEKGANGLEIAKKAYYNVTGKYYSPQMIRDHLLKEVSYYSSVLDTEIVAEVIVSNKNKPTKFTKAFVTLMKGRLPDEAT